MRRLSMTLSRKSLLTIYKSFVRPLLDYADIIYDKPYSESFKENLEAVQYNACLAFTGAIRGTSQEGLYRELGLETLNNRRWSRNLLFFSQNKLTKDSRLHICKRLYVLVMYNTTRSDLNQRKS